MSSSQSPVKPVLAPSDRLKNVAPYALAQVFQARDEKMRQGVDVIDLGVGNPDLKPQHAWNLDLLGEQYIGASLHPFQRCRFFGNGDCDRV